MYTSKDPVFPRTTRMSTDFSVNLERIRSQVNSTAPTTPKEAEKPKSSMLTMDSLRPGMDMRDLERRAVDAQMKINQQMEPKGPSRSVTRENKARIVEEVKEMVEIVKEIAGRNKELTNELEKRGKKDTVGAAEPKHYRNESETQEMSEIAKMIRILIKENNERIKEESRSAKEMKEEMKKQMEENKAMKEMLIKAVKEQKEESKKIKEAIEKIGGKADIKKITEVQERIEKAETERKVEAKKEKQKMEEIIEKMSKQAVESASKEAEHKSIREIVSKSNKIMEEIKKDIEKGKEIREDIKGTKEEGTYANVVRQKVVPTPKTLHSIIVTSTDASKTSDEVIEMVKESVDSDGLAEWFEVSRIRKAKGQKAIFGFEKEAEAERMKERIGNKENLKVEKATNKNPLIIVKYVRGGDKRQQVMEGIKRAIERGRNGEVKVTECAEIVYEKRTKNPHVAHVVVRVTPPVWRQLIEEGTLQLQWGKSGVDDQSPLIQCSRCLGYGHSRRVCEEELDRCSHCGEEHMYATCPNKDVLPSCINCKREKLPNVEHNTFNSACPLRQKWDRIARARVAYC